MDLTRGGGPGERPPIDPALEQQHELAQQREQTLMKPALTAELEQHLNQRPDLQQHLSQYQPAEQEALKQAIVDSAARFAPTASIQYVQIGKEDGKLYVQAGKYYLGVVEPEKVLNEAAQQKETAPAINQEPTPIPERPQPLRQEPERDNHLQHTDPSPSPAPYTGHSRPTPVNLPQDMTPERGPHLPQRLHDIQQQITQHIGEQLSTYSPDQQKQLTQALTQDISDFAGWNPQIKQIHTDETGLLHVHYNKTGELTLHPQQILQLEPDIPRPLPAMTMEEQQRQDTQQQLQQRLTPLTQHSPIDRLIIESRLREAVGDERIESLRIEGENTIELGLRNGIVLTATTHELLNMTDGRELLNRDQTDPSTQREPLIQRELTPEQQYQRDLIEDRIRLQIAEEARQSLDPLDGATAQRGPSLGRTPTQGIILIPQGNDGVRAILNLAADPYGLNEAIIGVHSAVAHLNAIEAENRIESLRQMMTQKGVKDLPQGFQMGLDRQGRSYRDYGRTIEQLQQRYLAHSEDMRLTSTWGADYRKLRIGKSGMTVQQFEDRVIRIQQQAVDGAYEQGLNLMARGKLPVKPGQNERMVLGNFMDKQVRNALRKLALTEGLPDSGPSNLFAVNRRLREPNDPLYGIPDVRLGRSLYLDTTLALKNGNTEQLMRWHRIRPGNFIMIRPAQLGGSYVVSPGSIKTPTPTIRVK